MPDPKRGEDVQAFVTRYAKSAHAKKKYPNLKQRLRVAYEKWRKRNRKGKGIGEYAA